MLPLDEKFIRRVYRTTGVVTFIVMMAVWSRWGAPAGLGIAAGSLLDLACLATIEWGVRRFVRPGVRDYKALVLYAGGMYPALLIALWGLVQCRWINLLALAAGVVLPNAVIVLKVIGRNLLPKPGDGPPVRPRQGL